MSDSENSDSSLEENRVRKYISEFRCFSVSVVADGKKLQDLEDGGKIIMPPSTLQKWRRLGLGYPMLFKITNLEKDRVTHAGVLEFLADEENIYIPNWMMRNLLLEEGGLVRVENAEMAVGTYSKFQAQSVDFLDITNPRVVLEHTLRNFACLTRGDQIAINYNDKIYELKVLETKPGTAINIIECDLNVDFAAPVGYKDPDPKPKVKEKFDYSLDDPSALFKGEGKRLDGKRLREPDPDENPERPAKRPRVRGAFPDYDHDPFLLIFDRDDRE